jgi:hypothetical protein
MHYNNNNNNNTEFNLGNIEWLQQYIPLKYGLFQAHNCKYNV